MAATLLKLTSRAELLRRDKAAELRQLVLGFEAEAPDAIRRVVAVIDRSTAAEKGWSFVMLSPAQNRSVVRWINSHAKRPRVSAALWAEFFCHMRTDTGEVVMSRAEMVEAAGASSPHISDALAELVSIGAVIRHREGREVRWFMNPRVATCLPGAAREEAQKRAPSLRVVSE